jgi:hypothetical protein
MRASAVSKTRENAPGLSLNRRLQHFVSLFSAARAHIV